MLMISIFDFGPVINNFLLKTRFKLLNCNSYSVGQNSCSKNAMLDANILFLFFIYKHDMNLDRSSRDKSFGDDCTTKQFIFIHIGVVFICSKIGRT